MKRLTMIVLCLCMYVMAWAEDIQITAMKTAAGCWVEVSLQADREYSGFQMDVVTEGAYTFSDAAVAPIYSSFSFEALQLSSGNIRLLGYTDSDIAIQKGKNLLLTMNLQGSGEAVFKFRNIRFTTAAGLEFLMPNATVALSVAPPPTYTLTFYLDDEVLSTSELMEGESVVAPDVPEREGYTFGGWQDVPPTMPADDVEIRGTYNVNYYTLTYILDGEEFSSSQVAYGSEIVAPDVPEKPGKTFAGWEDVPPTMPAHDVTVTGAYSIADGIVNVSNAGKDVPAALYTISGERIGRKSAGRGIYIENGRKLLLVK